jgi:hypothetical protein
MPRAASVWTHWGDYVLDVRDVRPGEAVSLGAQEVRFRNGSVSVGAPGAVEQTLQVGESVTVTVGALDYTLSCFEAEPARVFAGSGRRFALLDAALLGVLGAALAWRPAPVPQIVLDDIGVPAALGPLASPAPAQDQPVREPIFAVVAEAEAERLQLPGEMRCGDAEMGATVADTKGRYGVVGPPDNPDPHMARPVTGRGYPTAHGNFAALMPPQAQPGSRAPTATWGRDAALAADAEDAMGDMWSDDYREAEGENGLGTQPRAGGVVKRFDVAPLRERASATLRVLHTGLRITGERKASEIGRVMASRFSDFQACAEAAAPAALHDVELGFDVDEAGQAVANGMGGGELEQCLGQSLAGASFAAADERAHVVYPLHFVAADAGWKGPPVVRPSGSERCDCGG